MKTFIFFFTCLLFLASCEGQNQGRNNVGGPCEGCEALLEYGNRTLNPVDTIPGFDEKPQKLHVYGQVFQKDGVIPASDIIIYIYHTDEAGIYRTKGNEKGWAKRHGIHRGWVKTDENGTYDFYTFRPASYPNTTIAQHIHMTIKEPDTNPYYIDDILFTDDPMLTAQERSRKRDRAGSGIVTPAHSENGLLEVKRDIILGLNIPGY